MADNAILLIWIAVGLLSLQFIGILTLVIDGNLHGWYYIVLRAIHYAAPIIAFVAFLMWFSRACYNLHQKVNDFRYSELYAVGSWFIPIANLWKPYMVMKNLFVETNKLLKKNNVPEQANFSKKLFTGWWLSFIMMNILIVLIAICLLIAIVHQYALRYPYPKAYEQLLLLQYCFILVAIICFILWAIFTAKIIQNYSEVEPLLAEIREDNQF